MKIKIGQKYPKDIELMDKEDIKASNEYWEDMCGSCDFFGTDDCPLKNEVSDINNYKTEILCDNYWN